MRTAFGISPAVQGGVNFRNIFTHGILAAFLLAGISTALADSTNLEQEVRELREQNTALQQQLQKQNESLDTLAKKVQQLETANSERGNSTIEASKNSGFNLGKVNLSIEGGIVFFNTGSEGFAPHSEFRVDEARLFIEAPVWKEVYFYSDVDLATRENTDLLLYLNELYLDFQDVS